LTNWKNFRTLRKLLNFPQFFFQLFFLTFRFLDYLIGGTEISLVVGIDYTASNGNPKDHESLHYQAPNGQPNQYMMAIRTVGDIVAPYDLDKWFPVTHTHLFCTFFIYIFFLLSYDSNASVGFWVWSKTIQWIG
jgi:hypothetical protein